MWVELAIIVIFAALAFIASKADSLSLKVLLTALELVILLLYFSEYGVNWLITVAAMFAIGASAASLWDY